MIDDVQLQRLRGGRWIADLPGERGNDGCHTPIASIASGIALSYGAFNSGLDSPERARNGTWLEDGTATMIGKGRSGCSIEKMSNPSPKHCVLCPLLRQRSAEWVDRFDILLLLPLPSVSLRCFHPRFLVEPGGQCPGDFAASYVCTGVDACNATSQVLDGRAACFHQKEHCWGSMPLSPPRLKQLSPFPVKVRLHIRTTALPKLSDLVLFPLPTNFLPLRQRTRDISETAAVSLMQALRRPVLWRQARCTTRITPYWSRRAEQHNYNGPHKEYFQTPGQMPPPDITAPYTVPPAYTPPQQQPTVIPPFPPPQPPPPPAAGSSLFRRATRSVLWATLFGVTGVAAGTALITWEYLQPPFERGSPEDEELTAEIEDTLESHPLVEALRDEGWVEENYYAGKSHGPGRGQHLVAEKLTGTRGITMKLFKHPTLDFSMMVFFLGFGIEGWPDVVRETSASQIRLPRAGG